MIQIENLTQEQVDMLDIMWSLDTEEEYFEWYNLLDEADQKMADSLVSMVILEEIDQVLGNCDAAKEVLKKFAL